MSKGKFLGVISKYVPAPALSMAVGLWARTPFHFTVSRKRTSKYGDYRFNPKTGTHTITVNGDLNKYAFLITYVHEYAHLVTYERHGRKTDPHGKEWKRAFQEEMTPFLLPEIFPKEILPVLKRHMRNPKASSSSDSELVKALRTQDADKSHLQPLQDLAEGETFRFNRRFFVREHLRRTRFLCTEVGTDMKYLISKVALVEPVRE